MQVLNSIAHIAITRGVLVVSVGAILVSVSEFWFYEVGEEVASFQILLAYGFLGCLFVTVLDRFGVRTLAGLAVAAALLGFLIEGVPVPVVYSDPPMTIIWTSLAWHALITVGIGWVATRRLLARDGILAPVLLAASFGVFLGFWNAYMWNAEETQTAGEVVFDWQPPSGFIKQFLFGFALFLGGHILFDRAMPRGVTFSRFEHLGLWIVAAVISGLGAVAHGMVATYPVFVLLVAICLAALYVARGGRGPTIIDTLHSQPVVLGRFAILGLIPLTAIPTYFGLVNAEIAIEMNVVVILTAGPVSCGMFVWALIASIRQRRANGPEV